MAQALIVIDIQEGLVKENPFDTKNFIINTKAIIQHFRDQNIEVIFIRHSEDDGLLATGSDNWQVYHELKPQENEKIFNKYYNSIFKNSGLKEYLDSNPYFTNILQQYWNDNSELQKLHDEFSENTISNFYMPYGIAPRTIICYSNGCGRKFRSGCSLQIGEILA